MRRLAVSVATGRMAAIFIEDEELVGWCRSVRAFNDIQAAREVVQHWIKGFSPDHLIVEDLQSAARKGTQSRVITEAISEVFAEANASNVRVKRVCRHPNKYDEAEALVKKFASAATILPKRPPIWMPESRNISYFEALALVDTLIFDEKEELAIAID